MDSLLDNNVILEYWILDWLYEMSYDAKQYKNYNGLTNQQKNMVIMCVEKQIKVLLCFSSTSNLAFKRFFMNLIIVILFWYYENIGVQLIIVFHNRWIDYYYLVGEIDIYNTDAKGHDTKEFYLFEAPLF
jgi:hypothetical protein